MKLKISVLMLVLATWSSTAQKFTLKWSTNTETRGVTNILGGNKDAFYVSYRNTDKELYCRKYDYNANLLMEKRIDFNFGEDKKMYYEGAFFMKDRIDHFIYEHKRREDLKTFYTSSTDFNLNVSPEIKVLEERPDDDEIFANMRFSKDSTQVLLFSEPKTKGNDPCTYVFKIFDSKFQKVLLEKTVELPFRSKKVNIKDIQLDNFGNVYLLAYIEKEREEREDDFSKFCYKVFIINKTDNIKEIKFDYKFNNISSIRLAPGDNNTMLCSGFLRDISNSFFSRRKNNLSNEFFNCIIDCKTTNTLSSQVLELTGLYPEKLRKEEDFVPYSVRSVFNRKDGGYIVVAEQYKMVQVQSSRGYTYTYLYYCDIAVIHINNKSEVESVSRIPKYQLNAKNPSIYAAYMNDEVYILFEDLEKNLEASDDKEVKRSSNGLFTSDTKNAIFIATIQKDGSIKKEVLFSYKDTNLRPKIGGILKVKNKVVFNADDTVGILEINPQ